MKGLSYNTTIYILAFISVALIIASFIVPPMGVIDPSVLAAVGEIFGFAALVTGVKAIDKGLDAKVSHKNTTIEFTNDNDEE